MLVVHQVIVSLEWLHISCMVHEPSYHMTIRSIGVKYMKNNPERFTESSTDHSRLRYIAYISHQGTWADAIVIQAVADALNLTVTL